MHIAGHTPDAPHPKGGSVDQSAAISPSANEIESLKTQLLEARKQATMGELLGTTTHEFNNALTTTKKLAIRLSIASSLPAHGQLR